MARKEGKVLPRTVQMVTAQKKACDFLWRGLEEPDKKSKTDERHSVVAGSRSQKRAVRQGLARRGQGMSKICRERFEK